MLPELEFRVGVGDSPKPVQRAVSLLDKNKARNF